MSTRETLERPEGRLAYTTYGPADGELVVAAHGMGDTGAVYSVLATDLAAAGYRVAVLDLRGHGDSDLTFDDYDDEALASDLVALLEKLGPGHVAGNSMGAGAAVIAAAHRPDLVRKLVLIGPFARNPKVNPLLVTAMRVAMLRPFGPLAWKAYLKTAYPSRYPADHVDALLTGLRRPGRWRAFYRTTRTSHAPAEAALPGVRAESLVVMGTRDPDWPDPTAEAQWLRDGLDARLVLVEGAGHYPHFEFPEVVSPAVLAFLKDTPVA
ncbi:alpha/beta fold hydrolase [Spongisporangium articulatum]|uniref:Alpha/beta fold hydrolase n=1 Tax=Spongisporangium articulatum TaxID=3362603 RepID=A0ABW8ANJ4_9ACTN